MDLAKLMSFPMVASSHGHEIDTMIYLVHILMILLFLGWGGFFVVALTRFNRRVNPKANYEGVKSHLSSVLEVAVAVVEIILLIGFSIPFWAKQVNAYPTRPDTHEIRVIAQQFAWNIHYPGKDGKFGKTDIKLIDAQTNPIGLDSQDPNGKDDIITLNQMHLPVGRPVVVHLTSKDVMHSFGLPVMRAKQDVIPGMSIPMWFVPTKLNVVRKEALAGIVGDGEALWNDLIEKGYLGDKGYLKDSFMAIDNVSKFEVAEKFAAKRKDIFLYLETMNFQIACAQLCGNSHYRMKGTLTVETEEDFQAWLTAQAPTADEEGGGDDFWN